MTQLVAPHMRARRSGMIVNVGSIGGKVTLPWMTLYSASKSALGVAHRRPAHGTERDGVRTMLVCPGYVKTGFQKNVLRRPGARARCARRAASPSRPSSARAPSAAAWSATPAPW